MAVKVSFSIKLDRKIDLWILHELLREQTRKITAATREGGEQVKNC